MKHTDVFRGRVYALTFIILMAGSFVLVSCKKDEEDNSNNKIYTLSGDASGSQEVPSVTTTGVASLTGEYKSATKELSYTINWTGLSDSATAVHFHGPAAAGANAPPVYTLTITVNGAAGIAGGKITIADSLKNDLLTGKWYYNIHTALHESGEIRGQVTAAEK